MLRVFGGFWGCFGILGGGGPLRVLRVLVCLEVAVLGFMGLKRV